MITGLAGAESTSGAKEPGGDFSERGRGLKRGAGKQSEKNPGSCDHSRKTLRTKKKSGRGWSVNVRYDNERGVRRLGRNREGSW